MATELTSHERYRRAFCHQEGDRIPLRDSFWGATIQRWRDEGLPGDVSPDDFFGFDRCAGIGVDNSPRYPTAVVEETDDYFVHTTVWGVTQRNWKSRGSVPEFLDFTVVDRDAWADCKARMQPTEDRINWHHLEQHYARWRQEGRWIWGHGWFGFDVLHSWFVGTERVLMALVEDPEWVKEMIDTMCDLNLELLDQAWRRGYTFDCLIWPDDLAFVKGPFFSPAIYRAVVQPAHRRACEFAHERGAFAMLHTDGNILPLLPDILDTGIDAMQPLEQKAGMDLLCIKAEVGERLCLEGGIDVRAMGDAEHIEAEIRTKIPMAKVGGGYCYHSDHSVPSNVSFADYCRLVELVKECGRYD